MTSEPSADACHHRAWEAAYTRFQTPEEEIRKFTRRLRAVGATRWRRDARIVELFCGRGNDLHALHDLGFTRLEGVDLSASLLAQYSGPATCHVGECRDLPFRDRSRDIVIVHGGLHHLEAHPADLERTLSEAHRVLTAEGLFVAVEPWLTPFLRVAHAVCRIRLARRLSSKIDALATMIRHEGRTYEEWLRRGPAILSLLHKYFHVERCVVAWGKLSFVGRKRAEPGGAAETAS